MREKHIGRFKLLRRDVESYNIAIAYLRQELTAHLKNENRAGQYKSEQEMFMPIRARVALLRDLDELERRQERRP